MFDAFMFASPGLALVLYVALSAWRAHRAAEEMERFNERHGLYRR